MLKKLLRDNEFANPVFRTLLKSLRRFIKPLNKLTAVYRVYGVINLSVSDTHFKVYAASDDHIANQIFYEENYERDEFLLIKELTKKSRHFIDVGANTGIFSIFAAVANSNLQVVSFEPHPTNYNRLRTNIKINNLTNVVTFPKALGQSEKTIQFTIPADGGLSTTASVNENFSTNFHKIPFRKIDVDQLTFDAALKGFPLASTDLLKIDVEYYELDVLKGARQTLLDSRPLILIEILRYESLIEQFVDMKGKLNPNHAAEIQEFLKDLGYFPFALEARGVRAVTSVLEAHSNRNFLFLPRNINQSFLPFEDIAKSLSESN